MSYLRGKGTVAPFSGVVYVPGPPGPPGPQGPKGESGDDEELPPNVATVAYVDSAIAQAVLDAGTGDVVGPVSATDNRITRFDGITGKLLQTSAVTIDDSGNMSGVGTLNTRNLATDGSKLDGIAAGAAALSNATPVSVGAAAAGASTFASKSDHVHAHGVQSGGTTHSAADGSNNGFLTSAGFTKLAGIEALADVTDTANVTAAGAIMSGAAAGGGLTGTFPNPTVVNVRAVVVSATPPTTGQSLVATSATTATWQTIAGGGGGSGDVVGPASAVDNRITRMDGVTGKLVQSSTVTIDDSGNFTGVGTLNTRNLATDGSKLDGIAAGAAALSSATPAALGTAAATGGAGTTASKADHVHALVPSSGSTAGSMSSADFTKLAGIDLTTKSNRSLTIEDVAGTTYTFVLADAQEKLKTFSSSSPKTATVPPNSSVALPIGSVINLMVTGLGTLTIAPGAGVTIRTLQSFDSLAQYATISLIKTATDVWKVVGELNSSTALDVDYIAKYATHRAGLCNYQAPNSAPGNYEIQKFVRGVTAGADCVLGAGTDLSTNKCSIFLTFNGYAVVEIGVPSGGSADGFLYGAAYNGTTFVVVGKQSTTSIIASATNPATFTSRVSAATGGLDGVCSHNTSFVAVGASGLAYSSTNGTAWTQRTTQSSANLRSVISNGSRVVAVGTNSGGTAISIQSSDDSGVTWTSRTPAATAVVQLNEVCWTGTYFIAVGPSGLIMKSADAITWTVVTPDAGYTGQFYDVTYTGAAVVAVGQSGEIQTAKVDGTGWTKIAAFPTDTNTLNTSIISAVGSTPYQAFYAGQNLFFRTGSF